MDCSSDEYEVESEGEVTEDKTNGLGFFGGPAWHYPEEEIAFSPVDEVEDECAAEESSEYESCSGASMDNIRIAMIENYIDTHDIHDGDLDLLYARNRNIDFALSQPPQTISFIERRIENRKKYNNADDHYDTACCNSSYRSKINNNKGLPRTSRLASNKKRHTWTSDSPITKRRRRSHKNTIGGKTTANEELQIHLFREAAMCVPFEYTTKLATFYIRRPYGVVTVPEIFRVVSPHMTDEEYTKQAQVSSSQTIQVAISISADKSSMLLYGSAGVRYKTDSNDVRCDDWVDVPDVGAMDVPLGYVNIENNNMENHDIEYSLDEILEEAMFVREQYCSTILSAALEVKERKLLSTAKVPSQPSPPSLAKSIVSTPPRSQFYYDGSSNNAKLEEQEEEIKGRKLDFLQCISPSLMTRESNGTTSVQPSRQKRRRRRQLYRFIQRVIIVVGFYISGIFLVANLSVVDYHRPSTVVTELLPPSRSSAFVKNFLSWPANGQQQRTKGIDGDGKPAKAVEKEDDDSVHLFQIAEDFAASTNKRIENGYYAFTVRAAYERNVYKRKLETAQDLLREQAEQNNSLSKKYNLERTKTEELQKGKEDAVTLAKNLSHETEILAVDLEIEQGQRRKLEEIIRDLEIQVMTLTQDKSQMKHATVVNDLVGLEAAMTENAQNLKKGSDVMKKNCNGFEEPILEEQNNAKDYQIHQQHLTEKESPEVILVDLLDITNSVVENRYVHEKQGPIDEKEHLVVADKFLFSSPKNGMQSIENIILQSARANKGPVFPKIFRQITKRFSSHFAIDKAHGRRRDASLSQNKVKVFTSSLKGAISKNVNKIVRGKQNVSKDDRSEMDRPVPNEFANIVQPGPSNLLGNSMVIKEMLKNSTDFLYKQRKESSMMIRHHVKKNFDEVSTMGTRKLDHGQEAINVVGDYAKVKLNSLGKRVHIFATKKWRERRS